MRLAGPILGLVLIFLSACDGFQLGYEKDKLQGPIEKDKTVDLTAKLKPGFYYAENGLGLSPLVALYQVEDKLFAYSFNGELCRPNQSSSLTYFGSRALDPYPKGPITSLNDEKTENGLVTCTYKFKLSPNKAGLPIGDVEVLTSTRTGLRYYYDPVEKDFFATKLKELGFKAFWESNLIQDRDALDQACLNLFGQHCSKFVE